jgi:LysM repeat protein
MRVLIAFTLMALVALVGSPAVISAEANDTVCSTVLQTALVALESTCTNLQAGNVCLGFPGIQPSFVNGDTGAPFDQPGQQLALSRIGVLRSEALNVNTGRLGLAALSFAVPNSTPATVAATGLIIGEVELQLTSYSINVRTAYKESAEQCQQSPAMVILRSPDNVEATLYVNGAMLLLNGMIAIHYQSANSASFIVQEGSLQILNGPAAQAGNTLVAITDNTGTIMTWSAARPLSEKESQLLTSLQALTSTYKAFAVMVAPAPATPNCSPITHVVASGETLYRIAQRYNTSMQAIIDANNISNPDAINAGQALNIPCGTDSGPVTVSNPPANDSGGTSGDAPPAAGDQPPTGDTITMPCGDLTTAVTGSFNGIAENFDMSGLPAIGGGLPCE